MSSSDLDINEFFETDGGGHFVTYPNKSGGTKIKIHDSIVEELKKVTE